mmetsp:Transcript_43493/g.120857  ORF Transcript_43493/g.120857 Transcript_43493/m.120857 type:complete len:225 (+) Transcript_43493:709-1383(+)
MKTATANADISERLSVTEAQSTPPVMAWKSTNIVCINDLNSVADSGVTSPMATLSATAVVMYTPKLNITMNRRVRVQLRERKLATIDSIMIRNSRKNVITRTIRITRESFRIRMIRRKVMLEARLVAESKLMTSSVIPASTIRESKAFHFQSAPVKNSLPKPTMRRSSSQRKSQLKVLPTMRKTMGSSSSGLFATKSACTPMNKAFRMISRPMQQSKRKSQSTA